MTASILYPSITIRLRRLPDTFWHLVRSIVRASPIRRESFFRPRENLGKEVWADAIGSVQKSSKSEPSSRFLSRFKFLKIHMPLLGEFSRSSQDSCESDYDSHKSWDDRLNSPKSGGCQKVSGKLFTQKNKIDTAR